MSRALHAMLLTAVAAAPVFAAELRDPFVPVGYRPPEPPPPAVTNVQPAPPPKPKPVSPSPAVVKKQTAFDIANVAREQMERLRSQIQVQGVFASGAQFMAVINSQVVRAGDSIALADTGGVVRLRVKALDDRNVSLEKVEQGTAPEKGAPTQGAEP